MSTVAYGTVAAIQLDGLINVACLDGSTLTCAWLENGENNRIRLAVGDSVLLVSHPEDAPSVVMGRIGRYRESRPEANLTIEAAESLTLKCGNATIDLRADGKVMIRGEDVLVRAKGTQRIRAGTVSIN